MTFFLQLVRAILGIAAILMCFGLLVNILVLFTPAIPGNAFSFLLIPAVLATGGLYIGLGRVIAHRRAAKVQSPQAATPAGARLGAAPELRADPSVTAGSAPWFRRPWGRKRRLALLAVVLAVGLVWTDVSRHGLTLGSACGYGFGERHLALQDELVVSLFSEPLPAERQIEDVSCGGFQDRFVDFTLRLPHAEGQILDAALTRTFETGPGNPNFSARRERQHVTQPDRTVTTYVLPGVGVLHGREIVLDLPNDPEQPATVVFRGYTK